MCVFFIAALISAPASALGSKGDHNGVERVEAMKNVQIETVQTNGFTMDYFQFGHGKQALVILPGLSVESITKYADVIPEAYAPLTENFTIYVFDRRNELPATYSVLEMAEDTAAAFRALGLAQVSLFGASQGGMMAMIIAAEHPELVGKLILGSTSSCVEPAQYQTFEKWIQLAKEGNAADLYRAFGEAIYPPHVYEQARDNLTACAENVTEKELKRFMILAEGMKGFDVRDKLQSIACPVLVIGSLDDHVLGAKAIEEIAKRLNNRAGVELYMYDGYGHAAYDTAPDYKARLLHFLSPGSGR